MTSDEDHEKPAGFSEAAERAYAAWLANRGERGRLDIEALCREHPEHADELRRLHDQYEVFRKAPPETLSELQEPDGLFHSG